MKISKESQEFLENLRVYLISSGKKETEIDDVLDELNDHLCEAEQNGKNVDDIIGQSPKAYMDQLANEMPLDILGILKIIPILILGVFAYIFLGDAIRDGISISILEAIGYPIIIFLFLSLTIIIFKYLSSQKVSKLKQWSLFGILGGTPIASFLLLIILDKAYPTATYHFGAIGNLIVAILSILIFISLALWSKSWMMIMIPAMLFIPEFIIRQMSFDEETKLLIIVFIPPLVLLIYFLSIFIKEKKSN